MYVHYEFNNYSEDVQAYCYSNHMMLWEAMSIY